MKAKISYIIESCRFNSKDNDYGKFEFDINSTIKLFDEKKQIILKNNLFTTSINNYDSNFKIRSKKEILDIVEFDIRYEAKQIIKNYLKTIEFEDLINKTSNLKEIEVWVMKYSDFKPFIGKIINEKTELIKLPYLNSVFCTQKTLYDNNGSKHIIRYNTDTKDIYEILTLDFLNQRICVNNNPSIIKFNAKTNNLMAINYGNDIENMPSKITWMPDGKYKSITFIKGGSLHRTNGPAEIFFYPDGKCSKRFFVNGKQITDEFKIAILDVEDIFNTDYLNMRKNNVKI